MFAPRLKVDALELAYHHNWIPNNVVLPFSARYTTFGAGVALLERFWARGNLQLESAQTDKKCAGADIIDYCYCEH
jgi:hypothetical protein